MTSTIEYRPSDDSASEKDVKLRSIHCELNPLSRSDGSALLAQGGTTVLASMQGPLEAKPNSLKIENATIEVSYRPKSGLPTIKDKLREAIIKGTCESAILTALHPRTTISVQIQELDNRCGIEACAINAACMAILIGGVPMKFTIAAIHCIIDKDKEIILDPDHRQAIGAQANFVFVFDSLKRHLVACYTNGQFDLAQYNDAQLVSEAGSEIIFKFYSKIIARSQNKSLTLKNLSHSGEAMTY